jgi:hypothetical protein
MLKIINIEEEIVTFVIINIKSILMQKKKGEEKRRNKK